MNDVKTDEQETYIGDGVYASFDGYQIWLRAGGDCHENRIALEPPVYASLVRYRNSLYARIQARIESAPGGEGHDPDLDENGVCRVCGEYEPE